MNPNDRRTEYGDYQISWFSSDYPGKWQIASWNCIVLSKLLPNNYHDNFLISFRAVCILSNWNLNKQNHSQYKKEVRIVFFKSHVDARLFLFAQRSSSYSQRQTGIVNRKMASKTHNSITHVHAFTPCNLFVWVSFRLFQYSRSECQRRK